MADADLVAFLSGLERRQRPRAAIFDNTQSGPRVCNIPHSDDEGQESGKIQRFKNLWLNIIRLKFVEKCPKIFLKKIQNERTIECVATFHSFKRTAFNCFKLFPSKKKKKSHLR